MSVVLSFPLILIIWDTSENVSADEFEPPCVHVCVILKICNGALICSFIGSVQV